MVWGVPIVGVALSLQAARSSADRGGGLCLRDARVGGDWPSLGAVVGPGAREIDERLGPRPTRRALMVDMPVIVKHQDRDALRLDHRHDQALCRGRRAM